MKRTITVTFELEVPEGKDLPDSGDIATYLEISTMDPGTEQDPDWKLSDATVFIETPCIVANISGGVLQGASCEIPLEIITLDYEGDDAKFEVPGNGEAEVGNVMAVVDPEWVAEVREAWVNADDDGDE